MRWTAACLAVAACWTGSEEPPATPVAPASSTRPHVAIDVKLQRTACFGRCPVYTVEIAHDGKITWHGDKNVMTAGEAHADVPPGDLRQIARAVDAARFFDLDESGQFPSPDSSFVKFCTDTSHAIVTVTRAHETHVVDDAHCGSDDNRRLIELEQLIDKVAGTRDWIGR